MKKHRHGAAATASPAILAERGAEALRLGRFKEAVEVFKQLIRRDPQPQWTARLADAYAGRARALSEKGMFEEAAIVLENTRASNGTLRDPALYLTCLIRQGQHQKAAQAAVNWVGARLDSPEAARVAELAAALSLATPIRLPANTTWAELSRAAAAALRAWVESEPTDELDTLLARIPLRSPFGPLRLILKSLILPEQDAEKARNLLAMIPADSPFARFRAATEATLDADSAALLERWRDFSPAQRSFVAETRDLDPAATGLLSQLLEAERRGPSALFAVLVKPALKLPEADLRQACLDLLPQLPASVDQFNRRFAPLSALEHNRVLALAAEADDQWREAQLYWEAAVTSLRHDPQAQAVVLRHLADLAQCHAAVRAEPGTDAVADYFDRSLALDPDHLGATLALIERYRSADRAKEWHGAAEAAARRFPENTVILLHAVDAAVARNSYKKAAGVARRLLTLDPINQPARERMIELQLAHARKQARSGRPDLAAKTLSQAAEWERTDAPSAALRIGQALAGYRDQDPESEARLQEGVRLAGGGTVGWFRAILEAALLGWTDQQRQSLHRELSAAQASEPTREAILSLIETLGQKEIREAKRVLARVLWRIDPWLLRGRGFDWSPAELLTVAACLHQIEAFDTLRAYAQDALRRDAENPAARFYRIVAQASGERDRLTEAQENELVALVEQAGGRQDFHLFNRVLRFLDGGAAGRERQEADDFSAEKMGEFLDEAVADLAAMPEREVRKLVNEFGRNRTLDMLAEVVADTPLGEILTDQQLAELCAILVGRATAGRPHMARR